MYRSLLYDVAKITGRVAGAQGQGQIRQRVTVDYRVASLHLARLRNV